MSTMFGYPVEIVLTDEDGRRLYVDALDMKDVPGTFAGSFPTFVVNDTRVLAAMQLAEGRGEWGKPKPAPTWRVEQGDNT